MLPSEMIAEIGKYLDLESVLSCSLTSRLWRNALNANSIWKRLCNQHFLIYPIGNSGPTLRNDCNVHPPFSVPENNSTELDDLCSWRVRFAQQMRIQRNFCRGLYSIENAEESLMEKVMCWSSETETPFLSYRHNDDYFVMLMEKSNYFSIWSQWPSMHEMEPIKLALTDVPVTCFEFNHGVYFLYVQHYLLVVYERKNGDRFKLKGRFILHKDPEFSQNIPSDENITEWYMSNVNKPKIEFKSMYSQERYFIVEFRTETDSQLQIWDLKYETKTVQKVTLSISPLARFKCIISSNLSTIFFFYTENNMLCGQKLFRLNLSESRVRTFLRVTDCYYPCFFGSKFGYIKRGASKNLLKSLDLYSKSLRQVAVGGNMLVKLSPIHASVSLTMDPLEIEWDVVVYDMITLKEESIENLSIVRNGIYISRSAFANIFHDRVKNEVTLHVHNLKKDTVSVTLLNGVPAYSPLYRIGRTKFILLASKTIYNFW